MSNLSQGTILLVPGRIVWQVGRSLFEGGVKTDDNNRPILGDNGQPVKEYGFGLAIAKTAQDVLNKMWAAFNNEALQVFPSGQLPKDFAFKFKDGDGVDHNGKPFAERQGHAGHYVFACTTRIPINWYVYNADQRRNEIVNQGIKCGDYVMVQLQVKAHPAMNRGKAGLYLNPLSVQLAGYGPEIVNTPSGDQIFGADAPVVPQGASATPIAPAGAFMPMPAAPAAAAPMPMAPAAPAMPAPAAPVMPHYGVLPQAHQPAAPAMPAPAAPAPAMPMPTTSAFPPVPGR